MNIHITQNARKKAIRHGVKEKEILFILQNGKSRRVTRGALLTYIPENKIEDNKYLTKYSGIYVIHDEETVIEIFRNKDFRIKNIA